MKIYIDVIILVNTLYDFLILSSVSILLKKHCSCKRIMFGTLIGELSLIMLFISIDKIWLILFKIILSILMIKITFNDKDILEELFYFYIITFIIGGSQILISGDYYKVNIVTMGIISPIIIYLYIKSIKNYQNNLNKIYQVIITNKNNAYNLKGFIDTGNSLIDPVSKLPVIIINKDIIKDKNKIIKVPCKTINSISFIDCIKVDNIFINNVRIDALIGITNINIKKYDVLLNECLREKLND